MGHDVIIIGGGPAGVSAAIWCRRLGLRVLVLERHSAVGGQVLDIRRPIPDYPGLPAPDGPALAGAFARHLEDVGALVRCGSRAVAVNAALGEVVLAGGETLAARRLILATGARPRRLNVPGEAEMLARGESYRGSSDAHRFRGLSVVVVGGGDRALENAVFLAEAGARVTLIHRDDRFRARPVYLEAARHHPGITMWKHARVTRILGAGRVEGVAVEPADGGEEQAVECAAVFVYIGMEPDSALVRGQVVLEPDGRVRTDDWGRTSAPNVFAAGDVRTPPVLSSIATAVAQGMAAAKAISLEQD